MSDARIRGLERLIAGDPGDLAAAVELVREQLRQSGPRQPLEPPAFQFITRFGVMNVQIGISYSSMSIPIADVSGKIRLGRSPYEVTAAYYGFVEGAFEKLPGPVNRHVDMSRVRGHNRGRVILFGESIEQVYAEVFEDAQAWAVANPDLMAHAALVWKHNSARTAEENAVALLAGVEKAMASAAQFAREEIALTGRSRPLEPS